MNMHPGEFIEYYGLPLLAGCVILLISTSAIALSVIVIKYTWTRIK